MFQYCVIALSCLLFQGVFASKKSELIRFDDLRIQRYSSLSSQELERLYAMLQLNKVLNSFDNGQYPKKNTIKDIKKRMIVNARSVEHFSTQEIMDLTSFFSKNIPHENAYFGYNVAMQHIEIAQQKRLILPNCTNSIDSDVAVVVGSPFLNLAHHNALTKEICLIENTDNNEELPLLSRDQKKGKKEINHTINDSSCCILF